MKIRELGEKRFLMDTLLVDQAEIRVIKNHYDSLAGSRGGLHGGDDFLRIFDRRGIPSRIVWEVENEELLHTWTH